MLLYKVYSASNKNQSKISASQIVNRLGKYLYNHLDGAFQYKKSGNTFDLYTTLLYELKEEFGGIKNDVQEMTLTISITTYQNKIRVNTIEVSPDERTLGYDLLKPELLNDLDTAKSVIMQKVHKRIDKAYDHHITLY